MQACLKRHRQRCIQLQKITPMNVFQPGVIPEEEEAGRNSVLLVQLCENERARQVSGMYIITNGDAARHRLGAQLTAAVERTTAFSQVANKCGELPGDEPRLAETLPVQL